MRLTRLIESSDIGTIIEPTILQILAEEFDYAVEGPNRSP
jgi:hypothetical protein